jgi:hypothetical protein
VLAGFLGRAAHLAGWLGRYISPNKASVRCPWEDAHTSGERGDSSTVVFGPSEGRKAGWWHCSHAHCAGRTQHEFADMLPDPAKRQARIELGLSDTYLPPLATDSLPPPDGDEDTSWHRSLHLNAQNHPTKIPGNAAVLLANLPEWKYCLAIDEFADRVFWEAPPPAVPGLVAPAVDTNVSDDHVTYVQQWFAIHRNVSFSTEAVREARDGGWRRLPEHAVGELVDSEAVFPLGQVREQDGRVAWDLRRMVLRVEVQRPVPARVLVAVGWRQRVGRERR